MTKRGLFKDISAYLPATDRAEGEQYDKVGVYSDSDFNLGFFSNAAMAQEKAKEEQAAGRSGTVFVDNDRVKVVQRSL